MCFIEVVVVVVVQVRVSEMKDDDGRLSGRRSTCGPGRK